MGGKDEQPDAFVAQGKLRDVVYAQRQNKSTPAKVFVDSLPIPTKAQLFAWLKYLCDNGQLPPHRLWKLRTKEGTAWEFRIGDYRIGAFQNGRTWVLTHGWTKTGNRTDPREIDTIERIRAEYLSGPKGR